MGMYDSIFIKCPKCETLIELQSKSGPCLLTSYSADRVPTSVATGVDRDDAYCPICSKYYKVKLRIPEYVEMLLVEREYDWVTI